MRGVRTIHLRTLITAASALTLGAAGASAQQAAIITNTKPGAADVKRASIYDKTADANIQVKKAAARAKHDNKRILLMFGGDWCSWCHKLHGLFTTNSEIARILSNEYVVVNVELEAPHAAALLQTCKAGLSEAELRKGVGYPFLAVMDADSKVVAAQRTDDLEEGDHHDPKMVAAFLNKWQTPPMDGHRVVTEALTRASAVDKKVLLTFSAPGCIWCHELHNWLAKAEIAAILDRDFVIAQVDIERMTGGNDVMKSYRSHSSGGIPWYAILDSDGKSLATSDGPAGSTGYPAEPREIEHFLGVVKGQSRRIDASQLGRLRKSLDENADRIKNH